MAIYLLTYDLNKEVQRPPIVKFIKENYPWARLSESSYAIETAHPPETTYKIFSNFLDRNDQLYIIRLSRPYAGQGSRAVNEWLEMKLPASNALAA